MDRLEHIFKIEDFKEASFSPNQEFQVQYDSIEDKFYLKTNITNEVTPQEANIIISLLTKALQIRNEYKKMGS